MPRSKSRREFLKMSAFATAGLFLAGCSREQSAAEPNNGQAEALDVTIWFKDVRAIHEMTRSLLATDFKEQNPGISPSLQFVPNRQGMANLQSSHAAGEAPDLFFPARGFIQAILQLGLVHPIPDGVFDVRAEMGDRIADFYQMPDGEYYVLPTGASPTCLYYNTDLLEANGYTADDIPATWDEFILWAKALTVRDGDTLSQAGFAFNGNGLWLADAIRFQNDGWWFIDDKTCAWTEPETADAYQFVLDLFDQEKLQDRVGLPYSDQFAQGMAATGFARTSYNGLLNSQFPDLSWGTLPLPTHTGEGPYGRVTDETGFTVTTQSQDDATIDASWAVWRYLVGPNFQRPYAQVLGRHPSLKSLWDESTFSTDNVQWQGIASSALPGNFRNPGIWPGEVTAALFRSWSRVRDEGEPIDTVLADACEEVEKVLARQESWPLIIGKTRWEANPLWEK